MPKRFHLDLEGNPISHIQAGVPELIHAMGYNGNRVFNLLNTPLTHGQQKQLFDCLVDWQKERVRRQAYVKSVISALCSTTAAGAVCYALNWHDRNILLKYAIPYASPLHALEAYRKSAYELTAFASTQPQGVIEICDQAVKAIRETCDQAESMINGPGFSKDKKEYQLA